MTGHGASAVGAAGADGGLGQPLPGGIVVQVGDPGGGHFVVDAWVHRESPRFGLTWLCPEDADAARQRGSYNRTGSRPVSV
jgi:hypothetical protein